MHVKSGTKQAFSGSHTKLSTGQRGILPPSPIPWASAAGTKSSLYSHGSWREHTQLWNCVWTMGFSFLSLLFVLALTPLCFHSALSLTPVVPPNPPHPPSHLSLSNCPTGTVLHWHQHCACYQGFSWMAWTDSINFSWGIKKYLLGTWIKTWMPTVFKDRCRTISNLKIFQFFHKNFIFSPYLSVCSCHKILCATHQFVNRYI